MTTGTWKFAALMFAMPCAAQAEGTGTKNAPANSLPCAGIINTAADAAEKADWIVEGNLDDAMTLSTDANRLSLILSDMEDLKGGWPGRRGATGSVDVAPCYPGGNAAFTGPGGKNVFGKRMRLFGSKHLDYPARRVFYMEPATEKLGTGPKSSPIPETTKIHRHDAVNPISGGWHRARSTEGQYSIDMPAPFQDVTAVSTGKAGRISGYMLKATDANGFVFIAVREPNVPGASMAGSFDMAVKTKSNSVVKFKGVAAVVDKTVHGPLIMHSMMFRVPGGTYMLGVSVPKERETESAPMRERFYQSLAFD